MSVIYQTVTQKHWRGQEKEKQMCKMLLEEDMAVFMCILVLKSSLFFWEETMGTSFTFS